MSYDNNRKRDPRWQCHQIGNATQMSQKDANRARMILKYKRGIVTRMLNPKLTELTNILSFNFLVISFGAKNNDPVGKYRADEQRKQQNE
jgi:hypothetical protein